MVSITCAYETGNALANRSDARWNSWADLFDRARKVASDNGACLSSQCNAFPWKEYVELGRSL